jgi:hypothetical protein
MPTKMIISQKKMNLKIKQRKYEDMLELIVVKLKILLVAMEKLLKEYYQKKNPPKYLMQSKISN